MRSHDTAMAKPANSGHLGGSPLIPSAVKTEPHENLNNAIDRLDSVARRLRSLSDRIEGVTSENTSTDDPEIPLSLRGLLTDGPGRIERKVEHLHKCITEITEQLFDDEFTSIGEGKMS